MYANDVKAALSLMAMVMRALIVALRVRLEIQEYEIISKEASIDNGEKGNA
jgi:hypothetical protein